MTSPTETAFPTVAKILANQDNAKDEEYFKDYIKAKLEPLIFWWEKYPLSTRQLATALTEDLSETIIDSCAPVVPDLSTLRLPAFDWGDLRLRFFARISATIYLWQERKRAYCLRCVKRLNFPTGTRYPETPGAKHCSACCKE